MSNNQHIDNWVREQLGADEQQLNLGAWANMNRMLDGQNPYAKKDSKKWFIYLSGLALLLGTLGTLSYNYFTPTTNQTNNALAVAKDNECNKINENYLAAAIKPTEENKEVTEIQPNKENADQIQTNSIIKNENQDQPTIVRATKQKKTNFTAKTSSLNTQDLNETTSNSIKNEGTEIIARENKSLSTKKSRKNNNLELISSNDELTNHELPKTFASNSIDAAENGKGISTDDKVAPKELKALAKKSKKNATPVAVALENTPDRKVVQRKGQDYTAVSIAKKTIKVDGQKVDVVETLSVAKVDAPIIDSVVVEDPSTLSKPEVYASEVKIPVKNPRAVSLTPAEQAKADKKPSKVTPSVVKTKTAEPVVASTSNTPIVTSSAVGTDTAKPIIKRVVNSETWLMSAMAATIATAQKVGEIRLFNYKMKVNPGIFTGLNMAAPDAQHNFGGFQAGANVLLQLGRRLGLVQNLAFFMRNNGGYSVKDNSITITNRQAPVSLSNNTTAYSYLKDSIAISHNFKNVYAFEFPLVMQYQLKSVGFYGGVNFAYGFKMKPQSFSQSFKTTVFDTLSSSFAYSYPGSTVPYYKTTDFNSRFGIGYTAGVNYQFNPQIYVDLRFAKSTWDNATTVSAQQMSTNMFRLPTFSLSVGYRFNNNELSRKY